MESLPLIPQEARSFRVEMRLLFFRKASFLMFQPADTDGKVPHLLSAPKRLEASRRRVNSAM